MILDKTVCIMGLGYIGLPTAALLANRGYKVHGVDIDEEAVKVINQGKIHIVEPELDTFVHSAVNSGNLSANLAPTEADVFMIAVPTPFHHDIVNEVTNSPKANIDHIISATRAIAPFIKDGNLVLLESTSPVGTTDKMAETLKEEGVDIENIFVAHSPERVLPGHIMRELVENDRVIGGVNNKSTEVAVEFYRTFVEGEVLETNAKTAEMAKLTENSFRDVNIALANELSIICDDLDINVWELIRLANHHPRVNVLQPGCGVGGHCISVDPWFIVDTANGKAKLIQQARNVNDYKPDWVFEQVKNKVKSLSKDSNTQTSIACLGLAFKPDIDDLRESPALDIAKMLSDLDNCNILAVEPNIDALPTVLNNRKNVELTEYSTAVESADVVVVLVKHREFLTLEKADKILDFVNCI